MKLGMITSEHIRAQLGRILASAAFDQADRARAFLSFVVTASLDGTVGEIKESVIAVEALARTTSFDPKSDPIVRVEAGRLRTPAENLLRLEGLQDPIVITLPKGGYVPNLRREPKPYGCNRTAPVLLVAVGVLGGLALASVGSLLFAKHLRSATSCTYR